MTNDSRITVHFPVISILTSRRKIFFCYLLLLTGCTISMHSCTLSVLIRIMYLFTKNQTRGCYCKNKIHKTPVSNWLPSIEYWMLEIVGLRHISTICSLHWSAYHVCTVILFLKLNLIPFKGLHGLFRAMLNLIFVVNKDLLS